MGLPTENPEGPPGPRGRVTGGEPGRPEKPRGSGLPQALCVSLSQFRPRRPEIGWRGFVFVVGIGYIVKLAMIVLNLLKYLSRDAQDEPVWKSQKLQKCFW